MMDKEAALKFKQMFIKYLFKSRFFFTLSGTDSDIVMTLLLAASPRAEDTWENIFICKHLNMNNIAYTIVIDVVNSVFVLIYHHIYINILIQKISLNLLG